MQVRKQRLKNKNTGVRYLTHFEEASEKNSQRRKTPDIVQVIQRKEKEGSMHKDIISKNMSERERVWYGMY